MAYFTFFGPLSQTFDPNTPLEYYMLLPENSITIIKLRMYCPQNVNNYNVSVKVMIHIKVFLKVLV